MRVFVRVEFNTVLVCHVYVVFGFLVGFTFNISIYSNFHRLIVTFFYSLSFPSIDHDEFYEAVIQPPTAEEPAVVAQFI